LFSYTGAVYGASSRHVRPRRFKSIPAHTRFASRGENYFYFLELYIINRERTDTLNTCGVFNGVSPDKFRTYEHGMNAPGASGQNILCRKLTLFQTEIFHVMQKIFRWQKRAGFLSGRTPARTPRRSLIEMVYY